MLDDGMLYAYTYNIILVVILYQIMHSCTSLLNIMIVLINFAFFSYCIINKCVMLLVCVHLWIV